MDQAKQRKAWRPASNHLWQEVVSSPLSFFHTPLIPMEGAHKSGQDFVFGDFANISAGISLRTFAVLHFRMTNGGVFYKIFTKLPTFWGPLPEIAAKSKHPEGAELLVRLIFIGRKSLGFGQELKFVRCI